MDWKQELLKRLDLLADKLGTTSTFLWHVLVKQAIAVGVADGIVALVCIVVAVLGVNFWKYADKKREDAQDGFGFALLQVGASLSIFGFGIAALGYAYASILELGKSGVLRSTRDTPNTW